MEKTILLDMDGVLADFVNAAFEAHGREFNPDACMGYNLLNEFSMTKEDFWAPIDNYEFWRGLEPYPWSVGLLRQLSEIAPVVLVTTPSKSSDCLKAKREWVEDHLPPMYRDIVMGESKELTASENTLLIDDCDRNVRKFRESGGEAIVFPQPWNSGWERLKSTFYDNHGLYIPTELLPQVAEWACSGKAEASVPCREADPANPKDAMGSSKLPLHLVSPTFTAEVAVAKLNGMLKYGRNNYRAAPVRASVYVAAARRHLDAWLEGEESDPVDNVPHLGAAGACLDILADALAEGTLINDRNYKGEGYLKRKEELTELVGQLQELHSDKNPKHWTKQNEVSL